MAEIISVTEMICNHLEMRQIFLFIANMDVSSASTKMNFSFVHVTEYDHCKQYLRQLHFEVSYIFFQMPFIDRLPFLKSLLRFKNT